MSSLRFLWILQLLTPGLPGQQSTGELRLLINDPAGGVMPAQGELRNQSAGFRLTFQADPNGRYTARRLPFGRYRLELARDGFATVTEVVEIRSEIPLEHTVVLPLTA